MTVNSCCFILFFCFLLEGVFKHWFVGQTLEGLSWGARLGYRWWLRLCKNLVTACLHYLSMWSLFGCWLLLLFITTCCHQPLKTWSRPDMSRLAAPFTTKGNLSCENKALQQGVVIYDCLATPTSSGSRMGETQNQQQRKHNRDHVTMTAMAKNILNTAWFDHRISTILSIDVTRQLQALLQSALNKICELMQGCTFDQQEPVWPSQM